MRFVRKLITGVAAGLLVGIASADETPVDAAALFKRSCAMCHGQDGRATTPVAKKMGVKDLSHTLLSDDQIRATIVEGVKSAKGAMPAFGAKFAPAELDALVVHIRSLRDSENPAKP